MRISSCVFIALSLLVPPGAAAQARPNVILIMTDDQGIGDFGAAGNRVIRTPNLDAMAKRGASMSTFYVSPVCSPTRASLMTGRYNFRTRCIDTWLGRSMLEPSEVTIAEALRDAGYATGIFGKWHLGDCCPMRPRDQGFEHSLVHRGGGLAQPSEPRANRRRYTNPVLFLNGVEIDTDGYCTDVYFADGFRFIRRAHARKRPFFAYFATNAPHGPFHDVPEALREDYAKRADALLALAKGPPKDRAAAADKLSRIAAMITNIDDNIGRLFTLLDESGLTDNTLVIYLNDNGPNTRRYVGELRGMKSEVHEGGIRSPLWMHWPAALRAGVRRDEISAHIDVMPTVLDACGVPVPEGVAFDGRSLLPLFREARPDWPARTIAIQSHRGDAPMRYHHFMIRDQRWKLVHPSGFGRERFDGAPKFELYDVAADPGETNDLVDAEPAVVARLKGAYDLWFDDVSATRPRNYDPPRIHIGAPTERTTALTWQDRRGRSWSGRTLGYWLVDVRRGGDYEIRVEVLPRPAAGVVEVAIGETRVRAAIAADADSISLPAVRLQPGPAELRAIVTRGAERRGAYQVHVRPLSRLARRLARWGSRIPQPRLSK